MNPSAKIGRLPRAALGRALVILALTTSPALRVRGAEASASAHLVEAVVDAGQPAEYHIDVTNARPEEAPPAPAVDGLSITYGGPSQSRQYSFDGNGMHNSTTYTFVYSIETNQPGRFIIPGQDIRVGHETLALAPVTLNVMGAAGSNPSAHGNGGRGAPARQAYFVELVIPKKSAYVGESIPAEVRVYFGWDVQAQVDPVPTLNGEGFSVGKFTPPQTSVARLEGQQFRVVTYKTALAGVKSGTISIGPAEVTPVVRVPRGSPARSGFSDPYQDPYFNDPSNSFQQAPPKQVTLDSDPVTVEIMPLPPGKPVDFSGAIGQFKLAASADPAKVTTGDPVTLRLTLQGQGNFDRIEPPRLTDDTGLRTYPPTAKLKADDEVGLSGVKTFEQVVIPDSPRPSLPGYHFTYFDPVTSRYQTLNTPPSVVAIIGAPIASPTPATSAGKTVAITPPTTPPPMPRGPEDILYIREDFGRPETPESFLPLYRRAGFWQAQGVAALCVLALGAFSGWKRRTRDAARQSAAELQRQRTSLQRTLREQKTGRADFYSAARRLAQLKATVTSREPGADLTPAEICLAQRLPPEVADSVEKIFHRHAELVYSGSVQAQEPIPAEERRAVLATLDTLGKS